MDDESFENIARESYVTLTLATLDVTIRNIANKAYEQGYKEGADKVLKELEAQAK